ncbi:mitochondrial coenzyme A diphosphatase NUDT8 isoform X2 [Meriones unguiculatus]|uniref:mitochondrial coenzyme A diphosphatase NUDT8 isoform X2 n=1 Tax=Meriones unguiculatus TaxID=10047 RepID=UPI00293E549D|nr:mitochondrial coenzyme A diphosphatase NUDT8 isoform X2 [Meriones unguiculatus]
MLPDCLSAEEERRCRQLLAGTTARLRSRPATAAVLVPLCLVRGVPALLYTLRSRRLVGRHKGDVSFPGGKCDPTDKDVIQTALRETQEELGLEVTKEQVWGVLQPVYDRVDEVFELALAHLLQTQNQGYTHFCQGGHFHYTLPVFLHGPHRVWGLTAIITAFALKLMAPGIYQPCVALPELPRG